MRPLCVLLLVTLVGPVSLAQDKPLSQAELAKLPMYERMLKGDDAKKAADLNKKIAAAQLLGWVEQAIKLKEEVVALRTRVQGADHWQIADERIYLKTLRTLDADGRRDQLAADQANAKGEQLYTQGRYTAAQPLLKKALDIRRKVLGEEHPITAASYHNLAYNLQAQGKAAEAAPLFQKALDIRRKVLGEEHPITALSYNGVASNLEAQGKAAEAQPLVQKALDICLKVLGENHPETANSYNNVALNLQAQSKTAEAAPLFQKALDIRRKVLGENHPDTANSYNNLATNLNAQGKAAEAQPLYQKALEICRKVVGEDHPDTARSYNNLAGNLQARGKAASAAPLLKKAVDICLKVLGANHPHTATSYSNLAGNLIAQGKAAEAQPLLQKVLDINRKVLGEDHPDTAHSYSNVAGNLQVQGKVTEAATYLRRGVFSFEASRLNRAKGIERAIGGGFNPRLLLAAIEQAKVPAEAWNQVEASLARGLLDQQGQARSLLTLEETAERGKLRDRVNDLQSQILVLVSRAKRTDDENTRLEQLIRDRQEVGAKLAKLAVAESERAVANREQIQVAIPTASALLLWVDVSGIGGVEEHFACVVRREGEPFWVRLPGSGDKGQWTKDDSSLPARFREAIVEEKPLEELTRQLRRQRIDPVVAYLKKHSITQLFIVGVNQMAAIPVEVLSPEFTVSYVPSGTYLARLPKKPAYENTLLAVGDPIYEMKKATSVSLTALPPHGLLVQEVLATGAAGKVGLRAGDVLLECGSTQLEKLEHLQATIKKLAGDKAKEAELKVWRVDAANHVRTFTVQLPVGPWGLSLSREPAREVIANRRKSEQLLASLGRGKEYQDLPGSRWEVNRIAALFPRPTVLLDGKASEASIEALRVSGDLAKYRYLHFASHGEGNAVTAFESKLILSQDQPKEEFSKPGQPWQNNEISAREVLDHWKLNADLVTLSACQTALGKQGGGDGLLGFAQAFLLSGSRSVCISLWNVDDTATALLMQRFYQNLLGKGKGEGAKPMSKVKALQEAKKWLRELTNADALKEVAELKNGVVRGKDRGEIPIKRLDPKAPAESRPFAHPKFWSAFLLLGDPE